MKVLIATCVYEAARPYLPDWIDGVRSATRDRDAAVVAVVDGLQKPEDVLAPLAQVMPVRLVPSQANGDEAVRLSQVRALMLRSAEEEKTDLVVFCDADDVLVPDAIDLHQAALADAAISVGDLQPISSSGEPVGQPMLGEALPPIISVETLSETNICGFSNTAVLRAALSSVTRQSMPQVIAADWWTFATLLDAGHHARRAEGVVALYRQHENNILGSGGSLDVNGAVRRLNILASHHRARGNLDRAATAEALAADRHRLADAVSQSPLPVSGPWHRDAAAWCRFAMENS